MGRFYGIATALAVLVAADAHAGIKTVAWTAKAATVVNQPFGVSVPLNTDVTGYFTFDTSVADGDPSPSNGAYQQNGHSAFHADFLGQEVTGSHAAFYQVDLAGNTFRIYDGPRDLGPEGGTMSFNGNAAADIQLFVAITKDVFASDALIDPFPQYTFGFLGTPHTFTLKDDHGEMLLQFTGATEVACGDASGGGGVTAADALQILKVSVGSKSCLPCVCDVDGSHAVTASDALKTLRFAVGVSGSLACPVCL
ncbi:MAG TPA: hypothetical protein VGK20_16280 [Candidatus Binatia bacterium]|jgi:hypothetical protein